VTVSVSVVLLSSVLRSSNLFLVLLGLVAVFVGRCCGMVCCLAFICFLVLVVLCGRSSLFCRDYYGGRGDDMLLLVGSR